MITSLCFDFKNYNWEYLNSNYMIKTANDPIYIPKHYIS